MVEQQQPGQQSGHDKQARFTQIVLPHLGAAYNLARWLTSHEQDAEDVVQEACLRAFKFFDSFHGTDGRPWLLAIVRNTCYTWLQQNRAHELMASFDEDLHDAASVRDNPETLLLRSLDDRLIKAALDELPVEFREVMILREMEGLSYKEIARIVGVQLGTVMSRLSRARKRLQHSLAQSLVEE